MWPLVASAAAALTMLSFVPQIIKIWRTRSAADVSLITILQLLSGVILWIAYGIHRRDIFIIIANTVSCLSLIVLLALYARFSRAGSA